eukprot:2046665-Prymnesium_polylepis.1
MPLLTFRTALRACKPALPFFVKKCTLLLGKSTHLVKKCTPKQERLPKADAISGRHGAPPLARGPPVAQAARFGAPFRGGFTRTDTGRELRRDLPRQNDVHKQANVPSVGPSARLERRNPRIAGLLSRSSSQFLQHPGAWEVMRDYPGGGSTGSRDTGAREARKSCWQAALELWAKVGSRLRRVRGTRHG